MAKLSKTKKQLIMLGGLVGVIIGVVIWMSGGSGGAELPAGVYAPKGVSLHLSDDIFEDAEYKKLHTPVNLPLTPGVAGRDEPFSPFD